MPNTILKYEEHSLNEYVESENENSQKIQKEFDSDAVINSLNNYIDVDVSLYDILKEEDES